MPVTAGAGGCVHGQGVMPALIPYKWKREGINGGCKEAAAGAVRKSPLLPRSVNAPNAPSAFYFE